MVVTHLPHAALEQLQGLERRLADDYSRLLGFPAATDFDYAELYPFMRYLLNNVGDPYVDPLYAMHSKQIEREVLAFFASLFRAEESNYWGYVTTGGTEGNTYALFAARERLPAAPVYFSAAAHYSIPKIVRLLRMEAVVVEAQPSGELDYDKLGTAIAKRGDNTAIVVANIGTTMTEAKDNVQTIHAVLDSQSSVAQRYVHCDAALAGPYAALIEPRHQFDFMDGADSIAVSGHKFIGCPIPCGVVVVRKHAGEKLEDVSYIAAPDTTISGSRSGHAALFLWYAIKRFGRKGLKARGLNSLKLAAYTHQQLQAIGWQAWKNPQALTVLLAEAPETLQRKWQLATADGWSHIVCMPGVTQQRVDACIADLAAWSRQRMDRQRHVSYPASGSAGAHGQSTAPPRPLGRYDVS